MTDGPSLADKILAIHLALDAARLSHTFGGALALAWCTQRARGTIDIDVNVFVPTDRTEDLLAALPVEVTASVDAVAQLEADGQSRLWWANTPVDVFLDTTPFHVDVGERIHREPFAGHDVPFLACRRPRRVQGVLRSNEGLGGPRGDADGRHARRRSRRRHPRPLPRPRRPARRTAPRARLTQVRT